MRGTWVVRVGLVSMCVATMLAAGCASSSETAGSDQLTANVGKYPAGPAGAARPRVGVPPFKVESKGSWGGGGDLNGLAADQMNTLLDATERFAVIERTQLKKLLDEQNMEGIVRPGELAKQGNVRGVDFLLLGKVTNLRVKKEDKSHSFGLAQVGTWFGGADVKKKAIDITTECGVDIRLVDPSTGEVWVSNFSEYKRTDSASSLGVDILGASAEADANIEMSEDNKGKILRLALDDAVRKSLEKIDRRLRDFKPANGAGAGAGHVNGNPLGTPVATPATPAAKKFCPNCGKEVAAGGKFCGGCGAKSE